MVEYRAFWDTRCYVPPAGFELGGQGGQRVCSSYITPHGISNVQLVHYAEPLTPEEHEEAAAAARRLARDRARAAHEQQLAVDRAEVLLDRLLSPEQREARRRYGSFVETIAGTHYRINSQPGGGVDVLAGGAGEFLEHWCVYAAGHGCPAADHTITLLLMLRGDPAALRREANVSVPHRAPERRIRDLRVPVTLWQRLVRSAISRCSGAMWR